MQKINYSFYEVSVNPNTDWGGSAVDTKEVLARLSKEADANGYAQGRGILGKDADIKLVTVDLIICDSLDEIEEASAEEIRRLALLKLTNAEKAALGLV